VVPALRVHELVRFHTDIPGSPTLYTATFVLAMNKAKYDGLPADLKKIIDNNSGQGFSGEIGKVFTASDVEGKKLTAKNEHNVIPKAELEGWKKVGQSVVDQWTADVNAKGANGKDLLAAARALIAKHSGK
jgi:TRAP-type C4-dicarboxylate transport system substrate-binding protein